MHEHFLPQDGLVPVNTRKLQLRVLLAGFVALALLADCVFGSANAMGEKQGAPTPGLIDGIADRLSAAEVESRLPDAHPINYMVYAGRLWNGGEQDRAEFWYYLGELRYRFLLAANPNSDPSGEPAMFASLRATIGEPIVQYASSDTVKWAGQIDEVLKWDESHPNGYTSKTQYRRQLNQLRAGLEKLRNQTAANGVVAQKKPFQQELRETRLNNGVTVAQWVEKMPADWPAVDALSTRDALAGIYRAESRLGNALFRDAIKAREATTFEIAKASPDGVMVIARKGEEDLLRQEIIVREHEGAWVFEDDFKPDNFFSGGVHKTVSLAVNSAGDLVVRNDLLEDGQYRENSKALRQRFTFWFKSPRIKP